MNHQIMHLGRQIKKAELLSIDLFDTLLTRTFAQPTDLFYALEKKLKLHMEERGERFNHFAKARIESEFQLRKEKGFKQEVTLDEIYARLQSNMTLSKAQAQAIQKMELELEEQSIIPIKQVIDIIRDFKKTLKLNVILVSDTYFSEKFISKILKNNGLEGLCDRLYLSSTHNFLKSTGSMFQLIKKKENIPGKKWMHIGDNKDSDYNIPKRLGIKAAWFNESLLTRYERNYFNDPRYHYSRSTIAGLMKQARFQCPYKNENEKIIWDTTINVSAPLIIAYVHWCLGRAKALGLTRLYFMARDGQIMYKIANILNRIFHLSLQFHYLYVSRQSLLFPAMKELDNESLEWILAPTSIITPRIILNRINIEPEEIKHVIKKYGFDDADEPLERKELNHFQSVLFASEVRDLIQSRIKIYRENTLGYLQQENLAKDGTFALVDIGWNGTLQRSISRLLEMKGNDFAINGFYFGLQRSLKHKRSDTLETFFFSPETPHGLEKETYIIPIIEMFTAADHGGVIKYISENGQFKAILKDSKDRKVIHWGGKIQQRAMATLSEKITENNIDFSAIENIIFENTRLFITDPSREEAKVYGSFQIAEDQNEAYSLPLAEKYNLSQLYKHFRQDFKHHHNEWIEAARKLSNPSITRYFEKWSHRKKREKK